MLENSCPSVDLFFAQVTAVGDHLALSADPQSQVDVSRSCCLDRKRVTGDDSDNKSILVDTSIITDLRTPEADPERMLKFKK